MLQLDGGFQIFNSIFPVVIYLDDSTKLGSIEIGHISFQIVRFIALKVIRPQ